MVEGSGADVLMPIMEVEIEQDTDSSLDNFEGRLHKVYDDTDADELAGYIRQRWNKFASSVGIVQMLFVRYYSYQQT
jgi:hypothetical protein